MALVVDTNSYVSEADANAYFDNRPASVWEDNNEEADRYLVKATQMLDLMGWVGERADDDQELEWPRSGIYCDESNKIITLDSTVIPRRIKEATYELAHYLIQNVLAVNSVAIIPDNLAVGSIAMQGLKNPKRIPSVVAKLIKPFVINSGGIPVFVGG